ncbi:MAG TPA: carbohydrate ABC transporter permease [Anaerolineales bacterium]|jgi:putative chitobiose transport system permease protein
MVQTQPTVRTKPGDRLAANTQSTTIHAGPRRKTWEKLFWYALLILISLVTIFPFLWIFLTAFKGPTDAVYSTPPQLIPRDPTIDNFIRVWNQLPVGNFFLNSVVVAVSTTGLNVLITALAAYPFAKMNFPGRDTIFYLLLVTLIVPVQLTYIPSFILAIKVFHYHDTLRALILPNLASVFSIFLLRQAFKTIPNDLIDAAKIDGANELRIWWNVLLPVIRPSLAAVAIFTFVTSWNDFFWPSLMLPTMENKTLPVGLVALQGMFSSDFRGTAAGVTMTVIPIMLFFIALQRQFIRGLTGAVKG